MMLGCLKWKDDLGRLQDITKMLDRRKSQGFGGQACSGHLAVQRAVNCISVLRWLGVSSDDSREEFVMHWVVKGSREHQVFQFR